MNPDQSGKLLERLLFYIILDRLVGEILTNNN